MHERSARMHISNVKSFTSLFFFRPVANAAFLEAELAPKRDAAPGEATALEALLRGDSLLEKKNSLCKEEETLLEIQVIPPTSRAVFCVSKRNVRTRSLPLRSAEGPGGGGERRRLSRRRRL